MFFCHLLISNGNLNCGGCGYRGQLFWWPPEDLTLRLNHVSLEDSGNYVCQATVETPTLQKAKDNRTEVLVVAGYDW